MRTPAARPYLLPPDESVDAEPWRTPDGAQLPDRLDHWDPFTEVEATRSLTVDVDLVRSACRLPDDTTLAVVASWRSDRTRLSGGADPVELGAMDGTLRVPIEITVPGSTSGGRVELVTEVVLRSAGSGPSPLSPRRPGAVLWRDRAHLVVEGAAARFPLTAVEFESIPRLPAQGLWALDWSAEDLEAPVSASLRLLVNSRDGGVLDALRSGSSDVRSGVIRGFVVYDVARTLVEGALSSEPFVAGPESYQEGTLGRMLFELLASAWPGVPVEALARRLRDDRPRLDAELQAHLGVVS